MKVEIDQSWRIEYTNKPTVLADSMGNSVILGAEEKKYLQEVFRKSGRPRLFVYKVFAALLAILINSKNAPSSENLYLIDLEYPGWSTFIRNLLLTFTAKLKVKITTEQIFFGNIGKKSLAHKNAYQVFKNPQKAARKITVREILRLIF